MRPGAGATELKGGDQVNEPINEAAEPQQEPRRLLIVAGPDNTPQAWMDAPEAS
jgi:hypothetical protein